MQTLTGAQSVARTAPEHPADAAALDAVLVSVTGAGRLVVDQATARRRPPTEGILAKLPTDTQHAVAEALQAFGAATGEMPDTRWPSPGPAGEATAAGLRVTAGPAASAKERL